MPVDLQSMKVDHVLPERLLGVPLELAAVLEIFGLPKDFDLNDFGNWLPACDACNSKKLGRVFDPTPIIQVQIAIAREKAEKARIVAEETVSDRKIANSVSTIIRAGNPAEINDTLVIPLIKHLLQHDPTLQAQAVKSYQSLRDKNVMGLVLAPQTVNLTPFYSLLFDDGSLRVIKTPYGVGYQPIGTKHDASFYCGHCGSLGPWNGSICLSCGHLSDD